MSKHRSGCPVNMSLEVFGDRWSLLIIRDLMVRGLRTFKEFRNSYEKIATNILADRLRKLEASGIITAEAVETDRRRLNYRLTQKGIDLAPVLLELLIWGGATRKDRSAVRRDRADGKESRSDSGINAPALERARSDPGAPQLSA